MTSAALPSLKSARLWLLPENIETAVRYFIAQLESSQPGCLARLQFDAEAEVADWPDLAVRVVPDNNAAILESGCSTAGLYLQSTRPPTLIVAQSRSHGRNAFTILHELGHHLQRNDDPWLSEVLGRLKGEQVRQLEHKVCDAFASELLLPSNSIGRYAVAGPADASTLAAIHRDSTASRAAIIVRMMQRLPAHSAVMLTNTVGEILFGQANGELYPQPRGTKLESSFIQRAIDASGRQIEGRLSLTYRSGAQLSELGATACADFTGTYLFIVVTHVERYGQRANWTSATIECECGHQYASFEARGACHLCETPLCPECQRCACRDRRSPVCPRCFTELSTAEAAKGLVAHEDCP